VDWRFSDPTVVRQDLVVSRWRRFPDRPDRHRADV